MNREILHPLALNEYREATLQYGQTFFSVAERFVERVESSIEYIIDFPQAFPITHKRVRRCVLLKFPYSVLYAKVNDGIYIVAVMHNKRHPNYWKSRLKDIPE